MSLSLTHLIFSFGYLGFFITIFAESGFFLGFFLPGDSLLFTAGLFASQHIFNIWILILLGILGAIGGDSLGYWMGTYFGHHLFTRKESFFFKHEYVERTNEFYEKHGKKTIILARFVPIVRTFAPIMAGIGDMNYTTFLSFNVIGGVLWAGGFLGLSYWLGGLFPNLQHYLGIVIIVIIVLSLIPIIIDFIKRR